MKISRIMTACWLCITAQAAMASGFSPSAAQTTENVQESAATLKAGTILRARMLNLIDSDRTKAGKRFSLEVTQDVLVDGHVIVPRKSTVRGHVAEVKKYSSAPRGARLRLMFDSIKVPHGKTAPFNGVLAALTVEDTGPHFETKYEHMGTSDFPVTQMLSDADDVASFYHYVYDPDAGDGVVILCPTQDIHLGWDNHLTIRATGR